MFRTKKITVGGGSFPVNKRSSRGLSKGMENRKQYQLTFKTEGESTKKREGQLGRVSGYQVNHFRRRVFLKGDIHEKLPGKAASPRIAPRKDGQSGSGESSPQE